MQKPLILLLFWLICMPAHALTPVEESIRQISEEVQEGVDGVIAGSRIAAVRVLGAFYVSRGFRPAWDDSTHFRALLAVLRGAAGHGLDPNDYHYRLLSGWPAENTPRQLAERDILATDALIRYAYHLYFGKVDPADLDPDWNLVRRLDGEDPVAVIEAAVTAPSLADYVDTQLAPTSRF